GNRLLVFQENMKAPDEKKQTNASGIVGAPTPATAGPEREPAPAPMLPSSARPREPLCYFGGN
ncbi:hypothetical protein P7K49_017339, partial [Saguinus oedipus]